ncbi:hypothetical protein M0R04_02475 [Candidatus Dojkabacteria bacterium]|jgi:hypothetical protein|nr:hypothetical protein [Candidatus Dojkabacteria bacterium]
MPKKQQGINLLEPLNPPKDVWTTIYTWVFKVGRYLLVGIEIMLLGVFFARFVMDEINNDLTKSINDKTEVLSNKEFRAEEIRFRNLGDLFVEINSVDANQQINSKLVSEITSGIPSTLTLKNFSYNNKRVSLSIETTDLTAVKNYEFSLRQNTKYSGVSITITKSGTNSNVFSVSISFNITTVKK